MSALARLRKSTKRRELYELAGWRCQKCGEKCPERIDAGQGENFLTLDHVIPRCKGGPSDSWNLAVLCDRCNFAKGSSDDLSVWGGHPPWQYYEHMAWMARQQQVAC